MNALSAAEVVVTISPAPPFPNSNASRADTATPDAATRGQLLPDRTRKILVGRSRGCDGVVAVIRALWGKVQR